jgi:hypothetical protein
VNDVFCLFGTTVVSVSPRVLVVEDFLNEAEAADIIETAKAKMEPRFRFFVFASFPSIEHSFLSWAAAR